MIKRAIAVVTVMVLLVVGCQHAGTQPAERSPQELALLERSGGFAPMEVTLKVLNDGSYGLIRLGQGQSASRSGALTPQQFQSFRDQLGATRSLNVAYDNPQAADDFKYRLTYAGRTIRWSQAYNGLPAPLQRLGELLDGLLNASAP
jgi:hypothetical protein